MKNRTRLLSAAMAAALLSLALTACYTYTGRGVVGGTAAGALVGAAFGDAGKGAAIGAASGLLVGSSRDYRARQRAYYYSRPYPYYY